MLCLFFLFLLREKKEKKKKRFEILNLYGREIRPKRTEIPFFTKFFQVSLVLLMLLFLYFIHIFIIFSFRRFSICTYIFIQHVKYLYLKN